MSTFHHYLHTVYVLARYPAWDDYAVLAILGICAVFYMTSHLHWNKPSPYHHTWFERVQVGENGTYTAATNTRNIAEKLDGTATNLVIFWGSQSGTGERFSHQLARKCSERFGLEALVADISDYDHETIDLISEPRFAVFIMSTFGEGDPSDNASEFLAWLASPVDVSLHRLRYTAFGLGNSNYKYYNQVLDTTVDMLRKANAKMILPVGRGDDAKGTTEEDFVDWCETLFQLFKTGMGLEERITGYRPTIGITELNVSAPHDAELFGPVAPKTAKCTKVGTSAIAAFPVKTARELFKAPSGQRRCVHIEFDLAGLPEIKYRTGDHLAIWPMNSNEEVGRLLRVLGLESRRNVCLRISPLDSRESHVKVPLQLTIANLFQHHLDISAPVSRETVLALAQFAPIPEAKAFLRDIGYDKIAYATFQRSHHLNFGRLLELTNVTWFNFPLSFIIESLNPITPRYYSISSSSAVSPRVPSITAAVTRSALAANPNVTVPGLATSYLSALTPSTLFSESDTSTYPSLSVSGRVHAQIRRSKFKQPASTLVPMVLVANGSGLAPFRGFLQERARLASVGQQPGTIDLFFGCRDPEVDFIYKQEIEDFQHESLKGRLTVTTAFSRSALHTKTYVQDLLVRPGNIHRLIYLLVEREAAFYICGSATMARDVKERLGDCFKSHLGWDDDRLQLWFETTRKAKRWQEDVWG